MLRSRPGNILEQECIPVGCVPSAAVTVSGGGGVFPGVSAQGGVCLRGGGLPSGIACLGGGGCLPNEGVCLVGVFSRGLCWCEDRKCIVSLLVYFSVSMHCGQTTTASNVTLPNLSIKITVHLWHYFFFMFISE